MVSEELWKGTVVFEYKRDLNDTKDEVLSAENLLAEKYHAFLLLQRDSLGHSWMMHRFPCHLEDMTPRKGRSKNRVGMHDNKSCSRISLS